MAKRHQVQAPPVPWELMTLAKSTPFKGVKWSPRAGAQPSLPSLAARGTNLGHREADEQLPREAPLKKRIEIQLRACRVSEHSGHLVSPLPLSPRVQFTSVL